MAVLYQISLRWLSPVEALLPVLLTASTPVLFQFQSLVHGDIPMMLCLLLVLLCCMKWTDSRKAYLLVIAGLLAGVAAGIKYSGLLLLGFPVLFVVCFRKSLLPL